MTAPTPAPNREATPSKESTERAGDILEEANRPDGVPPMATPNTPLPEAPATAPGPAPAGPKGAPDPTPARPTPDDPNRPNTPLPQVPATDEPRPVVPDRAPPTPNTPLPKGQAAAAHAAGTAQAHAGAVDAAPPVRVARDARGVYTLTLARAQSYNALSESMLAALQTALDRVAADAGARAVVLAADGRAFCAGHDLKEMRAEPSLGYYDALFAQCAQVMLSIQRLPVPVIARVQGTATAAGCQLVAQCDLAVAASHARFAVSGVNLGLFCSTPAVALARNVPRKAAFEMLVGGDFIGADAALARGLVNRVVPEDELDAAVAAFVDKIVAKPRAALAMGKALFYRQLETGIESAYEDAGRTMAANMMEPTALEGVQAFIDKRTPSWAAH